MNNKLFANKHKGKTVLAIRTITGDVVGYNTYNNDVLIGFKDSTGWSKYYLDGTEKFLVDITEYESFLAFEINDITIEHEE